MARVYNELTEPGHARRMVTECVFAQGNGETKHMALVRLSWYNRRAFMVNPVLGPGWILGLLVLW